MTNQEYFERLEQEIADDPENDQAYFLRGEYYFEQKNYKKAQNDYYRATQINPEYNLARIALGYVYSMQNNQESACMQFAQAQKLYPATSNEAHWLEEITNVTRRISDDNQNMYNYGIRGTKLADFTLYQQAIADYSQAIDLEKNYDLNYYNRGLAYNEVKEYQLAIRDFSKAIELNPDDEWNYNDRGNSYTALKQYDLAIADYHKGLELAPTQGVLHNNLAIVYFDLEAFDLAIEYFKNAVEYAPDEASFHINLAEVNICADRYDDALRCLENNYVLIQQSIEQPVDTVLRLVLSYVLGLDTTFLEQALIKAKNERIKTGWDFDNLCLWFEKTQMLTQEVKVLLKKYLNIAQELE